MAYTMTDYPPMKLEKPEKALQLLYIKEKQGLLVSNTRIQFKILKY